MEHIRTNKVKLRVFLFLSHDRNRTCFFKHPILTEIYYVCDPNRMYVCVSYEPHNK